MFVGQNKIPLDSRNRLTLPPSFAKQLLTDKAQHLGHPLIIYPTEEYINLVQPMCFEYGVSNWIRNVSWTPRVDQIVANNKIHNSIPLYKIDNVSKPLQEANQLLHQEVTNSSVVLRKLSGRGFERFLHDILHSVGLNVQVNVRLMGTEVDLLLVQHNERGKIEYIVVECKHQLRSGLSVGISQVMCLYALTDVLRTTMPIKGSVLVSTTGFSTNAIQYAKAYDIELFSYKEFLDWVFANNLVGSSLHYPLLRTIQLNHKARMTVPQSLVAYLGHPPECICLGNGDVIEIWHPQRWAGYRALHGASFKVPLDFWVGA